MAYFIFHYSIDTPLGVDKSKICEREEGGGEHMKVLI